MTAPTSTTGVNLTEAAAAKAKALLDQEGRNDLSLRIAVQPGGVRLVVDKMSVPYLMGATIDFADTIEQQGFTIDNPNAGSACACGDSFN